MRPPVPVIARPWQVEGSLAGRRALGNTGSAPSAPPVVRRHPVRASHVASTVMSRSTPRGVDREPMPA